MLDAYAALGGKWTTDFPVNAADGNDQPERAIAVSTDTGSISSTIGVEGDVDWYEVTSAAARNLKVSLTGPQFNCAFSSNFGPRVAVYDGDLLPLDRCGEPVPDDADRPGHGVPTRPYS